MISRLSGKLIELKEDRALLEVGGIGYDVLLPPLVADRLNEEETGADVSFVTYYYLQMDGHTLVPILVGFSTEREREFFQRLIANTSLGAKGAVRILVRPLSEIAKAIELADSKFLESLPGIGPGKARELIAKLQGKIADFVGEEEELAVPKQPEDEMESDALAVLLSLHYRRAEALDMIRRARARQPEISSTEELIREALR